MRNVLDKALEGMKQTWDNRISSVLEDLVKRVSSVEAQIASKELMNSTLDNKKEMSKGEMANFQNLESKFSEFAQSFHTQVSQLQAQINAKPVFESETSAIREEIQKLSHAKLEKKDLEELNGKLEDLSKKISDEKNTAESLDRLCLTRTSELRATLEESEKKIRADMAKNIAIECVNSLKPPTALENSRGNSSEARRKPIFDSLPKTSSPMEHHHFTEIKTSGGMPSVPPIGPGFHTDFNDYKNYSAKMTITTTSYKTESVPGFGSHEPSKPPMPPTQITNVKFQADEMDEVPRYPSKAGESGEKNKEMNLFQGPSPVGKQKEPEHFRPEVEAALKNAQNEGTLQLGEIQPVEISYGGGGKFDNDISDFMNEGKASSLMSDGLEQIRRSLTK